MSALPELLSRIADKSAVVGVIGLGYVGLPLALLFEESGFTVVGFDIDPAKVESLTRGESYLRHVGTTRVRDAFLRGRISATNELARISDCDAVLICVPTPLGGHREPDLSFVRRTAADVGARLRRGQLVVLESTSYPGTTREELLPRLSERGLQAGEDFFLGFSPEREDPGNKDFTTRNIPKIVGGLDEPSLRAAAALYGAVVDRVVPVETLEIAESAKLLENVFRSVNIALVNELKIVLDVIGIDVWKVIEAAATKPFGFMPFYPCPGLGGHCIPLDPFYLSWKAAEHGVWARFVELAGEINTSMPRYVVERALRALNDDGKSVRGAKVLVLGLAYKPGVDDDRESSSYVIIELLRELGAEVAYCDPYFPVTHRVRGHDLRMCSVPCTAEEFGKYDAILVSTAHACFRDPSLYRNAKLVIDTRNVVAGGPARVVRA